MFSPEDCERISWRRSVGLILASRSAVTPVHGTPRCYADHAKRRKKNCVNTHSYLRRQEETMRIQAVRPAIRRKQPITATYLGRRRILCPHVVGTKNGVWNVLSYQSGSESSKRPERQSRAQLGSNYPGVPRSAAAGALGKLPVKDTLRFSFGTSQR